MLVSFCILFLASLIGFIIWTEKKERLEMEALEKKKLEDLAAVGRETLKKRKNAKKEKKFGHTDEEKKPPPPSPRKKESKKAK